MNLPPWETHDRLCPNRRPTVAFPNSACSGCRAVVAARAEGYARGLIEGDHGGRREGYRSGYAAGKDAVMTASYAQAVAEGQRDERERLLTDALWKRGQALFLTEGDIDRLRRLVQRDERETCIAAVSAPTLHDDACCSNGCTLMHSSEWEATRRIQIALGFPLSEEPPPPYRCDGSCNCTAAAFIAAIDALAARQAPEPLTGADLAAEIAAHDNKGFSEERCLRCGWVMGSPALNCNNDDTPHRFPSHSPISRSGEAPEPLGEVT